MPVTSFYDPGTWGTWVSNSTMTTTTNVVWNTWTNATTTYTTHPIERIPAMPAPYYTEDAVEQAEALLAEVISLADYERWRERRAFDVVGSDGHTYRIFRGVSGNVQEYVDGEHVATWCAHPRGVPEADVHIAQIISLRTDAPEFKRVANLHYGRRAAA